VEELGQMIKVGITGQSGFIGTHLFNYLNLQEGIEAIPFKDEYFQDKKVLTDFAKKCDCIVHLAALNRHNDPQEIYQVNIDLVKTLLNVLESNDLHPHLIMSSSIQEERDNPYGRSKKEGRELISKWAEKRNTPFTGLIIPNVFGPFGEPFYNSVVSTFAYQITHDQTPQLDIDAELKLIYVNNLVQIIHKHISDKTNNHALRVEHNFKANVSGILERLNGFHELYYENNQIPNLEKDFDLCLFNTYCSYIESSFFPIQFKAHGDERGVFAELIKAHSQGQTSFSTTAPGITRGDHFHIRKVERFAVIKGKAEIKLRRIGADKLITYHLSGDKPSCVDMPVWYTHNITNVGDDELITVFWINEFYDPQDPDTYFEKV
jgi:UDP-2-acetamido-2,6-beta-L-arabino-hexul-4-ose reductase